MAPPKPEIMMSEYYARMEGSERLVMRTILLHFSRETLGRARETQSQEISEMGLEKVLESMLNLFDHGYLQLRIGEADRGMKAALMVWNRQLGEYVERGSLTLYPESDNGE